jgi:hypothetical protein
MKPLENLSTKQRRATPPAFAAYLVGRVQGMFNSQLVAVLWCAPRSNYWDLMQRCDVYTERRNARTYAGPWPVICHPPCGPWGKYKANCRQSKDDGILAMEFVHRWGGIVEHPVGSSLFREHGTDRGVIETVNQADFGHRAKKPTLLYIVGP